MTLPVDAPSLEAIRATRARIAPHIVTTPVRLLTDDAISAAVGGSTQLWLKEELFQRTGSFKPRGALCVMLDLDAAQLARGVTGVSAGNHRSQCQLANRRLRFRRRNRIYTVSRKRLAMSSHWTRAALR